MLLVAVSITKFPFPKHPPELPALEKMFFCLLLVAVSITKFPFPKHPPELGVHEHRVHKHRAQKHRVHKHRVHKPRLPDAVETCRGAKKLLMACYW